jgi:hypothetical protein
MMAAQKVTEHQTSITAVLTDEERDLLETFAAEQGIDNWSDAIPALLHELVRLHDRLWDAQLAHRPETLEAMGNAALEAYEAGQTEDFNADSP